MLRIRKETINTVLIAVRIWTDLRSVNFLVSQMDEIRIDVDNKHRLE